MISSFFKQKRKHKRFNYEPRFYDPKEDERRRKRLKFDRLGRRKRAQPMMVLAFAIALFFVLWLVYELAQY